MGKRRAAGVTYPTLYATEAEAAADPKKKVFNCAQRAHANTLEYLPSILSMFAFLGCFHPKIATASVLVWVLSRFSYTVSWEGGEEGLTPDQLLDWRARQAQLGLRRPRQPRPRGPHLPHHLRRGHRDLPCLPAFVGEIIGDDTSLAMKML